jgi:ABC-type branched-subunit amino acid transport system permease subunit
MEHKRRLALDASVGKLRPISWGGALGTEPSRRFAVAASGLLLVTVIGALFVPLGVLVLGLVIGSLDALLAVALILVWKASRFVNFAQAELGAFAPVLAAQLVAVHGWNVWLAMLVCLALTVLAGGVVELLVVSRLRRASRLVVTFASLGVTQIFGALELKLPTRASENPNASSFQRHIATYAIPGNGKLHLGPVTFGTEHLLAIVAVVAVSAGLAILIARSRSGVAIRAVGENADQARLLGIPQHRISLLVWMLAGGLSGLAALLRAPIIGPLPGAIQGPSLLLPALAAAAVAGFEGPVTGAVSALALGMVDGILFFRGVRGGVITAVRFVVVVVALFAMRREAVTRPGEGDVEALSAAARVRSLPSAVARRALVRGGRWAALTLAAVCAVGISFVLSPSHISLLSAIVLYGVVALSLTVLTGYGGQVSLYQWSIAGVGALLAAGGLARANLDFLVGLAIAGLAGAALTVLTALAGTRLAGPFAAVVTLSFAVTASSWLYFRPGFRDPGVVVRPVLLGVFDLTGERPFFLLCLVYLAMSAALVVRLRGTRSGRNLVAGRDNPAAAEALGVRVISTRVQAFALSGFLAATAGYLYAYGQRTIDPGAFSPETSVLLFSMIVIGGLGSALGAVVGAIYVLLVQFYLPQWAQFLATGLGTVVLVVVSPSGLAGFAFRARDACLRAVGMGV